jgi:tetratricopeptide (TPR) repeat protein
MLQHAQPVSDYELELAAIDTRPVRLHNPPDRSGGCRQQAMVELYKYYLRAALTTDYQDFAATEAAIDRVIEAFGGDADLYAIQAYLNVKLHRLKAAKQALSLIPAALQTPALAALQADIALQEGRYTQAEQAYIALLETNPDWDNLARLAYFRLKTGQPDAAEQLYQQAQDGLSAKQMRAYAWLELQRGLIDMQYGRFSAALAHYRRADQAYSGYWLIRAHIAKALDLLGETAAAVTVYRQVIATTGNPEYIGALAQILERSNAAGAGELWQRADAAYAARLAQYREATLGHMIEYLLNKPKPNAVVLDYARENVVLRPNAESQLLLVRACLRLQDRALAQAAYGEILKTPWQIPQLAVIAAMEQWK